MPLCARPIFILGSPRSGSTILAWSLAQHDELWTSSETHFLWRLFGGPDKLRQVFSTTKNWPGGSWLHEQHVEYDEFVRCLGLGLNALFSSRSGGRRWIDQTPYYVYMADTLAVMFPGALFLHVLRDGRRVVHSMVHFANSLAADVRAQFVKTGRLPSWAADFREACREWDRSVRAATDFARAHPDRCLTVRHERLVADPEREFSDILHFLGVPAHPRPAQYLRSNRINSSFPKGGDPACAGPWPDWTAEQKDIFGQEAGETLLACRMGTETELCPSNYHRSLFRLQQTAQDALPMSSLTLVVSEGDDALLDLGGRTAWHFPRTREGWYDGHPADSADAIARLEALRRQGARYLLIPQPALWWLDYYSGFRDHLRTHYQTHWQDELCMIFQLAGRECPAAPLAQP
jgi:hypothetical protein